MVSSSVWAYVEEILINLYEIEVELFYKGNRIVLNIDEKLRFVKDYLD